MVDYISDIELSNDTHSCIPCKVPSLFSSYQPRSIALLGLHFLKQCFTDMNKSITNSDLRMYCIDRDGVPESHDAHAIYCLYD